MPPIHSFDVDNILPPPSLVEVAERLRRLLVKQGIFYPEPMYDSDAPPPPVPEWELFSVADNIHDPSGLRLKFRYRRPDLCGIEVYDLSGVRKGSWRRPLGVPLEEKSTRDAGIWSGGVTILDSVLQDLLPPPVESRVAEYRRLVAERTNNPPLFGDALATRAQRLNTLWCEMNDAERRAAKS